jgi:hypothetical protein
MEEAGGEVRDHSVSDTLISSFHRVKDYLKAFIKIELTDKEKES